MTETGKRIKALLNNDIKPSVVMFIDCLADWYKISQTIYLQTEILENDLEDQEELLEKVRRKLFILKEDMKTAQEKQQKGNKSNYKDDEGEVEEEETRNKDFQTFSPRDHLKTLFNISCDNKTLVHENEDLMSQLLGLMNSKGFLT